MNKALSYLKPLTLFCLMLFCFSCDQEPEYKVEEVKEEAPDDNSLIHSFPVLTGGNAAITQKINNYLTQDLLELEYGTQKESIFENITGDDALRSIYDLAYELIRLDSKLYSVKISAEGCGAYCEYFENYYTFDLATGDYLNLDQLFSPDGASSFISKFIAYKKELMNSKIAEADSVLALKDLSPDDEDYYSTMKYLYLGCFINYSSLEYFKFQVTNDSLTIYSDRCSPHAIRAVDELGQFRFATHLNELRTSLNELGQRLLSK